MEPELRDMEILVLKQDDQDSSLLKGYLKKATVDTRIHRAASGSGITNIDRLKMMST